MFRFTQEPSSGSYNQCVAKITSLVQLCMSVRLYQHAQLNKTWWWFLCEPKHVVAAFISSIGF